MSKSKYILSILVLVFTTLSLRCAKEGREQAVNFLNNSLKKWIKKEDALVNKYNALINEKEFKTVKIIKLIKKELIPELAKLRETISGYKTKNKDIKGLKNAYMNKLDYLGKGYTKIKLGLEKSNKQLLDDGRAELANYQEQQAKFKRHLKDFLQEYNIEIINREKK